MPRPRNPRTIAPPIVATAMIGALLASNPMSARGDLLYRAPFFATGVGAPVGWVRAVDLNDDGKLDLVSTIQNPGIVTVALGQGGGTFGPGVQLGVSSGGSPPVIADLNGDGKLDIAMADFPNTSVGILPGHGDGTFGDTVQVITGFQCYASIAGDVDGDGKLDLIVSNWTSVGILDGDGHGKFGAMVSYSTPTNVYVLACGDLNGDGKLDIVTGGGNAQLSVLFNDGTGALLPYQSLSLPSLPSDLKVVDATGDGKLDIVTSTGSGISIFPGHSNGTFGPRIDLVTTSQTPAITVADLNHDTHPDLIGVLGSNGTSSNTVNVFLGDGSGGFPNQSTVQTIYSPSGIDVGDLDGDGNRDLIIGGGQSKAIALHFGNGDGTFGSSLQYTTGATPIAVALGDLDGDSKIDMIVANQGSASVSVRRGNGNGTFGVRRDYDTPNLEPSALAVGDLDGDGHADVAITSWAQGGSIAGVMVFNGYAGGAFSSTHIYPMDQHPSGIAIGDLNGDGAPDLVITDDVANRASVMLNSGSGSFLAPTHYGAGNGASCVAIGDLNGDSKLDVVTANYKSGDVTILFGAGDGGFSNELTLPIAPDCRAVAIGFLDGDVIPDLVTANGSSGSISVMLGQGAGTFAPAAAVAIGGHPQSVAIARLDGDAIPDLVLGNAGDATGYYLPPPSNLIDLVLGTGGGNFDPPRLVGTGELPQSVAVADLDGSGGLDIVAAAKGSELVSVLVHTGSLLDAPLPPVAVDFTLHPGYPNPSSSAVTFDFALPRDTDAILRVFDTNGRVVRTLASGRVGAGSHSALWDRRSDSGTRVAPGIYFCDLRAGSRHFARRIVLL